MSTQPILHSAAPARYRLCLQGQVTAAWHDYLAEVVVTWQGHGPAATTTLTGRVADQAALFGLLNFIRDLNVPLRRVEWIPNEKENDERH